MGYPLHYLAYRDHRSWAVWYEPTARGYRGYRLRFNESFLARLRTLQQTCGLLVTYARTDGSFQTGTAERQISAVTGPNKYGHVTYALSIDYYAWRRQAHRFPAVAPAAAGAPLPRVYAVVPPDTRHPILYSEVLPLDVLVADLTAGYDDYL